MGEHALQFGFRYVRAVPVADVLAGQMPPPTSSNGRCSWPSAILLGREEFGARAKRGFLFYDGR
jgi:hypothetical protein